jgi:hypothetical protein
MYGAQAVALCFLGDNFEEFALDRGAIDGGLIVVGPQF